jgi:3'(2'), 5'-bisphosphate nucleotidase
MISPTTEFKTGLEAVRTAARLCEAVRAQMVLGTGPGKLDKQDRSPVTVADFGAQAIVCQLIGDAFAADTIVAEEASAALREAANAGQLATVARFVGDQLGAADEEKVLALIDRGQAEPGARFWVLDPIDGTKGFLRNDQYAIALALIEDGAVQWGFLGCPVFPRVGGTGVLFVAQRGRGAQAYTLAGDPLGAVRVSALAEPANARLAESVESAHTNRGLSAQVQESLGITAECVRMDSQAKYAAVARGQAEIYLRSPNPRTPDYRENIWDHAAGWIIVEEAGGKVTDVYGRPMDWTHGRRLEQNIGVVATNGRLHDAVIGAIAGLLPPLALAGGTENVA